MSEGRIVRPSLNNLRQIQAENQVQNIIKQSQEDLPEKHVLADYEKATADYSASVLGMTNKPDTALITETCKLPSKGLLYNRVLGDSLELRSMTTIEERMRLSGENFWSTMSSIMNRCMVNTNFDAKNLVDFDFFAALVTLRIVTYGNIYKTTSKCLSCQKVNDYNLNLDTLVRTDLPDDFVEPIEIGPMPRSKDTLGIRFLRVFDHIDIVNKINEYNSQGNKKEDLGNPEYTLEMEKMLVSVNGIELDPIAKHMYIEKMLGMDSSYFHNEVEKLFYGIHRVGTGQCEECGGLMLYQVAPDENFFRTAFDN